MSSNATMSAAMAASLASGGVESLGFLNDIIAQLWEYINVAASQLVKDIVQPMFAEMLPGPLSSLHFTKIDLGDKPIKLDNIDVHSRKEGVIKLDVDVFWDGDCDIELKANLIGSFGVEKVKLGGRMSVILTPLVDRLPLVTALQVAFVNPPKFDLEFTGVAGIAEFSIINKTIFKIIHQVLNNILVLPNRMLVKVDPANKWFDTYQNPIGFLRLTVVRGSGFAVPKGWIKDIPDVYCKVKLGALDEFQTRTEKNSVTPQWLQTVDFMLSDQDQAVMLEAMDDDLTGDDKLGSGRVTVGALLEGQKGVSMPLLVKNVDTGARIELRCEIMQLTPDLTSLTAGEHEADGLMCGLLTVLVSGVKRLPVEREEAAGRVDVEMFGQSFSTPVVCDVVGVDATNPPFDAGFRVQLTRAMVDEGSDILLKLYNKKTKLGSMTVALDDVKAAENGVLTEDYVLGNGAAISTRIILRGIKLAE